MNRREFLKIGSWVTVSAVAGCRSAWGHRAYDDNLTVFVSDLHIKPGSWQVERFGRVVDRILVMDPLPRRVVCLGDIACIYGCREDYEASRPLFERLASAGVELTLGMGNHDRRKNFLVVWPEYRKRLLIPDRIVSETSLGTCDLVLLDTLWEDHTDETRMTKVDGEMFSGQLDWVRSELLRRTRPYFLAAHHPIAKIVKGDAESLNALVLEAPNCLGWLHGHDHVWKTDVLFSNVGNGDGHMYKRSLCLPSTGHWGDIGYVTMRTGDGFARADLTMHEHYFSNPAAKTWIDDEIVQEKQGQSCTFRW